MRVLLVLACLFLLNVSDASSHTKTKKKSSQKDVTGPYIAEHNRLAGNGKSLYAKKTPDKKKIEVQNVRKAEGDQRMRVANMEYKVAKERARKTADRKKMAEAVNNATHRTTLREQNAKNEGWEDFFKLDRSHLARLEKAKAENKQYEIQQKQAEQRREKQREWERKENRAWETDRQWAHIRKTNPIMRRGTRKMYKSPIL
eukprot:Platyproteum_vivax@DN11000_c0_g1_i1.p1